MIEQHPEFIFNHDRILHPHVYQAGNTTNNSVQIKRIKTLRQHLLQHPTLDAMHHDEWPDLYQDLCMHIPNVQWRDPVKKGIDMLALPNAIQVWPEEHMFSDTLRGRGLGLKRFSYVHYVFEEKSKDSMGLLYINTRDSVYSMMEKINRIEQEMYTLLVSLLDVAEQACNGLIVEKDTLKNQFACMMERQEFGDFRTAVMYKSWLLWWMKNPDRELLLEHIKMQCFVSTGDRNKMDRRALRACIDRFFMAGEHHHQINPLVVEPE